MGCGFSSPVDRCEERPDATASAPKGDLPATTGTNNSSSTTTTASSSSSTTTHRYHAALRAIPKKQFSSIPLCDTCDTDDSADPKVIPSSRRNSVVTAVEFGDHHTTLRPPPLHVSHKSNSSDDTDNSGRHVPFAAFVTNEEYREDSDASCVPPPCMSATTVPYMNSAHFTHQRSGSIAISTSVSRHDVEQEVETVQSAYHY